MRRLIASICLIASSLALATVNSPLATTNDYKFTSPLHPWFVQGKILGTDPQPRVQPLRGEDQVYLFECATEISKLLNLGQATKTQGIDPLTPSKFVNSIINRGVRPFSDIFSLINSQQIWRRDAQVTGWTNSLALGTGSTMIYDYAIDSMKWSNATATNDPACVNLGDMALNVTNVRALVATNVAAFYKTLKDVGGFAKDYAAQDSASVTNFSTHVDITDARFSYTQGWIKERQQYDQPYTHTGGGIEQIVNVANGQKGAAWPGGGTLVSGSLPSSEIGELVADEQLTCELFPSNWFANATQVQIPYAWVICTGYCSDDTFEWLAMDVSQETNWSTNFVVVTPAIMVQVAEENGKVIARVTPNYSGARDAVFGDSRMSPHRPDPSISVSAPPVGAIKPTQTLFQNYRHMRFQLVPSRVAFVVKINWHSGFQSVQ